MPHFTIEYSANLDGRVDMAEVVEVVRKAAVESGIFPLGGIRVRAIRCEHYAIADGHGDYGFLDMLLRLGEGRDLATRKKAGEHIFRALSRHLDPVFKSLAPGSGDIARTPGREKLDGTAERGYLHCGPNGAGHFVKMVHNGIEYGIMAAYAEGLSVLRSANVGKRQEGIDAETTPLRDPEHYQYDLDLKNIAEVWRRGSVIASWLLDLTATALVQDPGLSTFAGRVSDSGEGRWTIKAAIDEAVPTPVLTASLYERFSSRGEADYADKLLSAMRFEFGGHLEKPAEKVVVA